MRARKYVRDSKDNCQGNHWYFVLSKYMYEHASCFADHKKEKQFPNSVGIFRFLRTCVSKIRGLDADNVGFNAVVKQMYLNPCSSLPCCFVQGSPRRNNYYSLRNPTLSPSLSHMFFCLFISLSISLFLSLPLSLFFFLSLSLSPSLSLCLSISLSLQLSHYLPFFSPFFCFFHSLSLTPLLSLSLLTSLSISFLSLSVSIPLIFLSLSLSLLSFVFFSFSLSLFSIFSPLSLSLSFSPLFSLLLSYSRFLSFSLSLSLSLSVLLSFPLFFLAFLLSFRFLCGSASMLQIRLPREARQLRGGCSETSLISGHEPFKFLQLTLCGVSWWGLASLSGWTAGTGVGKPSFLPTLS